MVRRGILILLLAGGSWAWAQPAGPPAGAKPPGSPGERQFKGMFNWPRPGAPHLPTPFLLAGDPRFEKMVRLAFLPEEQMLRVFNEWPEAQELPPEMREELPQRLTTFRDRVRHEAVKAAEEWGIALTQENRADFVRAYWEERIRLEREIRTRAQAELEQRQSGIRQNLMTRFGVR